MSRPYTETEIRTQFINHIKDLVNYWEKDNGTPLVKDKLEGLAFSILTMLDGEAADLPGFEVKAIGTKDDITYFKANNENYYPLKGVDIAGCLHEDFLK
jgi:hypothetical protein